MSQTFTDDVFAGGHTYSADMGAMETNFATLKSMFSGASAPSSPTPAGFQPWADTGQYVLKYRNAGATAWVGIMHGDTDQKAWFYVNSAMDGWAVDSGVSDKVVAVKGGSTYTTGGATAGQFALDSMEHYHQYIDQTPSNGQRTYDSGGSLVNVAGASGSYGDYLVADAPVGLYTPLAMQDVYTSTPLWTGAGAMRPEAAVGTLQYMDL